MKFGMYFFVHCRMLYPDLYDQLKKKIEAVTVLKDVSGMQWDDVKGMGIHKGLSLEMISTWAALILVSISVYSVDDN